MDKKDVKIFVTYKDKHKIIKSDIITPIQTGRAIADEKFEGMIGDDTGDNISNLNNIYSELSAMYWVWKHYEEIGNPKYIGFIHYRRQFLFDVSKLKLKEHWISSYYKFNKFNKKILNAFSDEKITKEVKKYDYLIPNWHDTQTGDDPIKNIREEYIKKIKGSKEKIFDKFIDICKTEAPNYLKEIEKIETGSKVLVCNMFIMKKELFFQYCNFAFPILKNLVNEIDSTLLTKNGQRFAGYMGEKLLSMFIMKLEGNKNLKEKFLYCSYIKNPDFNLFSEIVENMKKIIKNKEQK